MFIAALFTTAKIRKLLKCQSTNESIKKLQPMNTMEYQSAIKKKNEILQYATCVDMVNIVLSEISQRRKNTVYYHVHVESKKYAKIMNIMKQKLPFIIY